MNEADDTKATAPPVRAGPSSRIAGGFGRVLMSEDLLAGEREVAILHGKETYRLRLTAAGKLILTK